VEEDDDDDNEYHTDEDLDILLDDELDDLDIGSPATV